MHIIEKTLSLVSTLLEPTFFALLKNLSPREGGKEEVAEKKLKPPSHQGLVGLNKMFEKGFIIFLTFFNCKGHTFYRF